jgi:cytoskeleton protein RodZ
VNTPAVAAGEVTSTLQQGSALAQGAGSAAPSGPSAGGISNPAAVAAGSSGVANNPATTQDIAASLPKPTGQAKIEIATVRDAWVEIRDGSGALVTNRLFRAGSKESVSLTSTTGSVVIGSATGVTLHWNGNPIDLKPHTKDDVARMNLK